MNKQGFYNLPDVDIQHTGTENYMTWVLTIEYNLCAFMFVRIYW